MYRIRIETENECSQKLCVIYYITCIPANDFKSKEGVEPPRAASGHTTYIDGKMLSVTKYRFQMNFWYVYCVILCHVFH